MTPLRELGGSKPLFLILRLRHILKTIALPALYRWGVLRWLDVRDSRPRRIALNFHDIDAATFREHAGYLQQHAEVVDIETFLSDRRATGKPRVVLTFDDGYASFAKEIAPILAALRLPATWFVATAPVETQDVLWFDRVRAAVLTSQRDSVEIHGRRWPLLSWNRDYVSADLCAIIKDKPGLMSSVLAQLGEAPAGVLARFRVASREQLALLDHDVVTVGSHSHTHPQMSSLDDASLASELTTSKRLLEEWTQREVRHFAFPSGDYDGRAEAAVKHAGYVSAWTTEPRFQREHEYVYRLPRVAVPGGPVAILSAKMLGWHARWKIN